MGALEHALGFKFGAAEDDVGLLLGGALDFLGHPLGGDHGFFERFFSGPVVLEEALHGALVFAEVVVLPNELFHLGGDEIQEGVDFGLVEASPEAGAETLLLDVKRSEGHGGTIRSHVSPAKKTTADFRRGPR